MKKTNKLLSILLAVVLVFAMAIPVFAATDGTITITNAENGETYSAYRMLDFTPVAGNDKAGTYKVAEGWENFFTGEGEGAAYFDIAENGFVTIKDGVEPSTLAAAAMTYAKTQTATKSATATNKTVTLSELALGYYLVDTSLGTICALTNTNSDVTAIEKNKGPALEKKILEGGSLVDANTAAIGDTVTYQATITIGKGVSDYVMHDTFSTGLTYSKITSVKANDKAVADTSYTVTNSSTEDGCTFEIAFNDNYTSTLSAGSKIIVTYEATVNENAVIGSNGNPNEAHLKYNNGDEIKATPTDIVITYTTSITVNKTDEDGHALSGAGFTLYKKSNNAWTPIGDQITGVTTFLWKGLDEGEYKIVETKIPAGYNKAKDVEFTISALVPETVDSKDNTATWKARDSELAGGVYTTDIENLTGSLLPETGGIGTTIFYIAGALLVVGAAVLLITKKRMSAEV